MNNSSGSPGLHIEFVIALFEHAHGVDNTVREVFAEGFILPGLNLAIDQRQKAIAVQRRNIHRSASGFDYGSDEIDE